MRVFAVSVRDNTVRFMLFMQLVSIIFLLLLSNILQYLRN